MFYQTFTFVNTRVQGEFENVAAVEKFELSKDEYSQEQKSSLSFLLLVYIGSSNVFDLFYLFILNYVPFYFLYTYINYMR